MSMEQQLSLQLLMKQERSFSEVGVPELMSCHTARKGEVGTIIASTLLSVWR